MTGFLLATLGASLIGSPHCAGMCGPFVVLASEIGPAAKPSPWAPWLYHLGRLIAYATLGAIAGAFGAAFDLGGRMIGWQRPAAIVAGVAMMVIGAIALLRLRNGKLLHFALPAAIQRRASNGWKWAMSQPPSRRSFGMGLATAMLPCGWLYAFVAAAAGTASAAAGAFVLAAFWLGTVPLLVLVRVGAARLAGPFRRLLPVLPAVLWIVVGAYTATTRAFAMSHSVPKAAHSVTEASQQIAELPKKKCPCCEGE